MALHSTPHDLHGNEAVVLPTTRLGTMPQVAALRLAFDIGGMLGPLTAAAALPVLSVHIGHNRASVLLAQAGLLLTIPALTALLGGQVCCHE